MPPAGEETWDGRGAGEHRRDKVWGHETPLAAVELGGKVGKRREIDEGSLAVEPRAARVERGALLGGPLEGGGLLRPPLEGAQGILESTREV